MVDLMLLVRATLARRYTIHRPLGGGAMASVYLAHDRHQDRPVALKVFHPDVAVLIGPDRFLQEIAVSAQLTQPHILPVFDSGQADGLLYYTMPYIAGGTLRERLTRESQLPIDMALRIVRDVADALTYAHGHGFVHRDIKPENILLEGDTAIVADFGIVKAIDAAADKRITESGISIGTPAYMSPEQGQRHGHVDGRSDTYSLACVCYEMLCGEPPFTGPSAQAIIARHMYEDPRGIRVVRSTVSPSLERAVLAGLAKVPADRPTSATAFAGLLETATHPAGGDASTDRRRRTWVAVMASAVLAVGGATALWLAFRPGMPLDSQRVVVFPPVDHAGVGPEAGESVSIMIASVLERSDPLQWEEGWRYLDDNQRRDYRLVTMDDEAAIARRLHARYFIDGSLARSGDSAMVTLVLNDARTGRALARASAPGPLEVGALVASGFRALIQLLPTLIDPERGVDQEALAALVSPSPVATAHWINGERLYRQADWAPALEQFRLAVALDSGMVFAALKGAQAGSWLDRQEEVQSLLGVAERHRNHLPPKYAAFLTALHHYHHGQSDSAQRSIHAALDLDPHWAEAWMVLGEIRYHLLPAVDGPPDSLASIAFRRAVAASPNFTPARYHLAELALRDGNLTEARGSIDTLLATAADTSLTVQLELMDRCLREGPDAVSWRDQLAEHAGEVYQAAVRLAPGARHTRCATAAFSALLGDATSAQRFGWPALLGLQGLLLAAGRPDAALALLDSAMVTMPGAALLYLVDATADADAGMEDRAAAVMAQLAGTYETMSAGRLWLHGLWQAHLGHGDSVAAIAARFGALVSSSDPLGAARHLALEARAAALAGRSEEALSLLGEMDPPVPADGVLAGTWQPFAAERLLRARLELSVGKPEAALRTARVFDDWNALVALAYLRPSVEVRVAAAAALGRLALADSLRRRLGDHPSIAGGDR